MQFSQLKKLFADNGLLSEAICPQGLNPEATAITCDSREVIKGSFFFAKGLNFKPEYLISAVEKGAAVCIAEDKTDISSCPLPLLRVKDIRLAMPLCAKYFYGDPASRYPLTGITGTKGKTTVAYMLKDIFDSAYGGKTGIISTNEALSCSQKLKKSFTTPEALELYGILDRFARDGVKAAVIEVSSQGLQYNRVEYIEFFAGVFLNLSPDHISATEHHSFEEYKNAKKRMLTVCKNGFVNIDDPYAEEMLDAATCKELYTFGLSEKADFYARDIKETAYGSEFALYGKFYNGERIKTAMPGDFNIYNALAAVAVATVYGIDINVTAPSLAKTRIPGRMELYSLAERTVIVDYAHNGLSFEGIFRYAKRFFPGKRIICVFGCTGNKALDRRREIPAVAGREADYTVLTSDDPAFEKPEDIMEEVAAELRRAGGKFERVTDREEAIARAAAISRPGDVLILAGKGHEHTQAVRGRAEPYIGDREAAEKAFEQAAVRR